MRPSCVSWLVLSCLLVISGCGAASAVPAQVNHATPTSTPTPGPTSGPLPTSCPQFPAAQLDQTATAPLSLYVLAPDANDSIAALNAGGNGTERWRKQIASPGNWYISMATGQNVVYLVVLQYAQGGYVEALNASDGQVRWCTPALPVEQAAEAFKDPSLAVDAGVVYVGDGFHGSITAFDASDGKRLWQTQAEGSILSLTVAAGQLYASSEKNISKSATLYTFSAFDARTGQERWHVQGNDGAFSAPTVVNGVVYVGRQGPNFDGFLSALNASDGAERWHFEASRSAGFGTPVVVGDVLYAVGGLGTYAVNASDGSLRWQTTAVYGWGPVVANGVLYIGGGPSEGAVIYAVNASDGSLRWQSDPIPSPRMLMGQASPGVSMLTSGPDSVGFLEVVNGVIYASTADGTSAALNSNTGKIIWAVPGGALAVG
jgi:outer membrane protein assembly factor BamB